MVNGVNNTYETWNPDSPKGKSVLGKDDFMKLMLNQLKHQDPLNPMENTEFSAQLAQFTSLEQLSNMNKTLESSIEANFLLTQSINNTMTANLIGKEAKLTGNSINFNGQKDVTLGYTLPVEVKDLTIKIFDQNGKLVRTVENASKNTGDQRFKWDFTDDNGNKLPQGNYSFEVSAKDFKGEDLTIPTFKFGFIDSVKFTDQGTKVISNNVEYILSDIIEISGGTSSSNNEKDSGR